MDNHESTTGGWVVRRTGALWLHVGERRFCREIPRLAELDETHPRDFAETLAALDRTADGPGDRWTNHPYALDCLSAERIFVHDADGVRRLDTLPDYARWVGLMRSGEFWSAVGERRPDPAACGPCSGTGVLRFGTSTLDRPQTCRACGGTGQSRHSRGSSP